MADRSIRVRLIAEVQSYKAAMAQAGAATKDFGRELAGQGTATAAQMERVGRSALLMAGVMGAGLGLAAKAAIDWESAWAGVTKTVDGSAAQMAGLEDGLRGLAKELPATHAEIAGVAEAAGQLGIKRQAIVGFTETMIALGETTNLSADQAATGMAQMANIMQTSQGDVDRMGASLVALGNAGASTESEILDMSLRLAGAGRLIGASEADVMALANAMASVGIEAQLGGGAMSRVMQKIYTSVKEGGDALAGFAQVAGMSSAEFTTAFEQDPVRAVDAFVQGLNRVEASGGNVVSVLSDLGIRGTEETGVLLRLKGAGDLLAESLDLGTEAWEDNTALMTEAEKRYATTAAQLEIFRNNAVELGIDIGGILLPMLAGAADGASSMARGFGELPVTVQAVGAGLGVISTAGLGAIGVIGTLGPKVAAAREALMSMGSAGQFLGRNMGRITLAAGGAMAALGVFSYLLGEHARKTAEAKTRTDELVSAIQEEEEGLRGAVAASQAKALADSEVGTILRETAADYEVLTDGLANQSDAVEALDDNLGLLIGGARSAAEVLELAGIESSAFTDELIRLIDNSDLGAGQIRQLVNELDGEADRLEEAETKNRNLADATSQLGTDSEAAADKVAELPGPLGLTGDAAKTAQAELDAFNSELDRLLGAAFDFDEASDALSLAILDAGDHFASQAENLGAAGLALDDNSRAGLENQEVMRGLIDQAAEVIRVGTEQGMSVEALNMIRESEKQRLRELAERYGLNQDQVEAYIAVLDGIPLSKGTTITAVDNASTTIRAIQLGLRDVKSKTITITAEYQAVEHQGLRGAQRWGGITSYAGGGINAHIGHGDLIRYAEPETGGEAYIPRLGDAARSRKVLETAASWYGLAVIPAGGYGPMTAARPAPAAPATDTGRRGVVINGPIHLQTPDSPRQWLDELSWRLP